MPSYDTVLNFENRLANFFGSNFAVATDCCTHAIELCLRYKNFNKISCPKQTYLSIPMTLEKLNLNWHWEDLQWKDYYRLGNTNILDAANHWEENGYIKDTFMCLSFQFKKPLSLGRGGAILLDNKDDYIALKKMTHDGRDPFSNDTWKEHEVETIGYHYYMIPEIAEQGLTKMNDVKKSKSWTNNDYPTLTTFKVFER